MCLQTRNVSDPNMSTPSNKNIFLPLHVERYNVRKSTNYPQLPILSSYCMLILVFSFKLNKNIHLSGVCTDTLTSVLQCEALFSSVSRPTVWEHRESGYKKKKANQTQWNTSVNTPTWQLTCLNLYRSLDFSWKLSPSSSLCRFSTKVSLLRKFLMTQWGKGWQSNSRSPATTQRTAESNVLRWEVHWCITSSQSSTLKEDTTALRRATADVVTPSLKFISLTTSAR